MDEYKRLKKKSFGKNHQKIVKTALIKIEKRTYSPIR
jgi:hypothetical protein